MERTEEAIKNGQFRDIDNIFCTRHRTKTNKAQKTQHRKVAEKLPKKAVNPGARKG
jgi:hypothetical protein